jgi:signal transduction histidine kinase
MRVDGASTIPHRFLIDAGDTRMRNVDRESSGGVVLQLIVAMQLVTALLLVIVYLHAARTRRIVARAVDQARRSATEYDRARRDFEQLVRHRISNPLAVVQGVAITLDEHPELPAHTRRALVGSMVAAAEELVAVSLDPHHRTPAERELRAVPDQTVIA